MHLRKHDGTYMWASLVLWLAGSMLVLGPMAAPVSAQSVTTVLASGEPPTPNGQPDPHTTITPDGVGGRAVKTTNQPVASGFGTIPDAQWVSRTATGGSNAPTVNYTYVREFTLPECFRNASVRLEVLVDDGATVRLNTQVLGSATSATTPAVFVSTALQPGLNRLTFDVADGGFGITGLAYKATITYDQCDPAAPAATAVCDGRPATIVGTAGGDILRGTGSNDVIVGGGGGDIVHGLDGDDVICVDGGGSIVHGGPGNDRIFAGNGGHNLFGDDGNDHLQTGSGGSNLDGGPGEDTLLAGGGGNNFRGGDGSDTCTPSGDLGSTYTTCNP